MKTKIFIVAIILTTMAFVSFKISSSPFEAYSSSSIKKKGPKVESGRTLGDAVKHGNEVWCYKSQRTCAIHYTDGSSDILWPIANSHDVTVEEVPNGLYFIKEDDDIIYLGYR